MSTEAGICFNFRDRVLPSSLVRALAESGWGCDLDGTIGLLSSDSFNDGEWETVACKDLSHLLRWAEPFDTVAGGLGFLIVHRASGIGGTMVMDQSRNSLSWGISVNIPHIDSDRMLVDFSKCLSLVWPAIKLANLNVVSIDMHVE